MTYIKDPDAILDYAIDWTSWLAATETITTHTVIAPAGITVSSSSAVGGVVTVWLTGGTAGTTYDVTCRVSTSQGRTDDRTFRVIVQQR